MITLLSFLDSSSAGRNFTPEYRVFPTRVQLALASIAPGFLSGFFAFTSRLSTGLLKNLNRLLHPLERLVRPRLLTLSGLSVG